MNRFSANHCINTRNGDVNEFVSDYLINSESLLFIGTVGIQPDSLYFPRELSRASNAKFKFFVEKRPDDSTSLMARGEMHRVELERILGADRFESQNLDVIATDGATVAGRNATKIAGVWLNGNYKDIVIDTTGMSRGTSFPIVRQAMEFGEASGTNIHLLIAASDEPSIKLKPESNGHADWMHGFQRVMGTDYMSDALKLWVPQLTEGSGAQMSALFKMLNPLSEVCPIVPFPSKNPRRGDELLLEYFDAFESEWDASAQNLIYASESDPLDVYRTISRMHGERRKVFPDPKDSVTVLSPAGWRIGSLGMLLAALDLELPVLYVETMGYTTESAIFQDVVFSTPNTLWHIWLAGTIYNETSP